MHSLRQFLFRAIAVCLIASVGSLFARDVILTWIHSTSPGVTAYKIYRGTVSGGPYSLVATTGYVNTYTDANVSPGTYYYVATAMDGSGNESAYSNQASATVTGLNRCDIDNSGSTNVVDIQRLVNVVLGTVSCPISSCDITGDGAVNILDIQTLVNIVLGVSACPN